jgi:hypothetical protein
MPVDEHGTFFFLTSSGTMTCVYSIIARRRGQTLLLLSTVGLTSEHTNYSSFHTYDICEVLPLHCTSLYMFMKYSRWPTHAPYVGSRRKLSLLRSTWRNAMGDHYFDASGCWTWVDAHDWKIMVVQLMQTAVAWYGWPDPLLPSWCICYLSPSSWILFATHHGLTGFNWAVAGTLSSPD